MKAALVTGGSRGIGRAVALKLSGDGYHVIINYLNSMEGALETLSSIKAIGGTGEILKFDVGNPADCAGAVETWQNANPDMAIEVLVNNAGIREDNLMAIMSDNQWYNVINTNLNSFYNVTKPVLKQMISKRKGRIITISSLSGQRGIPGQTNYSAAKAGLIGATKALALEVASRKITVNAIAPGLIKTDMVEGLNLEAYTKEIPAKRLGEPEEIASLVSFLAGESAGYITGQVIAINGGLYL